jgi:hypothetical protein
MEAHATVVCRGHPQVRGTHPTTFEITAENHLTAAGDCIIGVAAECGVAGLPPEFRRVLCHDHAVLLTRLSAGDLWVEVHSRGSAALTLAHPADMVWRRSRYVDGRTVGILSDCTAATLPRDLIALLRKGETLVVEMTASLPNEEGRSQ